MGRAKGGGSFLAVRVPAWQAWLEACTLDSPARGLGRSLSPRTARPRGIRVTDPDQEPLPTHPAPRPAVGSARYLSCPRPLWWCGRCRTSPGETGRQGQHLTARPAQGAWGSGPGEQGPGRCLCRTLAPETQAAGASYDPVPLPTSKATVCAGGSLLGRSDSKGSRLIKSRGSWDQEDTQSGREPGGPRPSVGAHTSFPAHPSSAWEPGAALQITNQLPPARHQAPRQPAPQKGYLHRVPEGPPPARRTGSELWPAGGSACPGPGLLRPQPFPAPEMRVGWRRGQPGRKRRQRGEGGRGHRSVRPQTRPQALHSARAEWTGDGSRRS